MHLHLVTKYSVYKKVIFKDFSQGQICLFPASPDEKIPVLLD
jgi:hypothetical protein